MLLSAAIALSAQTKDAKEIITDAPPQVLSFKYRTGDTYRILSKVHEDAYFNRRRVNHAEIVNRISVKVLKAHDDGSGTLEGTFMTTENSTAGETQTSLTFGEEFLSRFDRSSTGRYTIGDEYFMPIVRDDPIFPETPVAPGDSWEREGYEAEDLRRAFGMEKPFKVPFLAKYTLLGVTTGEKKLFVIDVKYELHYKNPMPPAGTSMADLASYPVSTTGYSNETLYWDNERGEVNSYIEDFRIEIETYYGDTYLFQGIAEAEVLKTDNTNTDEKVQNVQETINGLGLKDITVKRGEKGLTIALSRIQFLPDSTELLDGEKEKIKKIADIIAPYANDLLVTGHCALRGTKEEQERISLGRAKSVADYLIKIKARDEYHVFTQGKGAAEAIASNGTEEGRAMNRRVEITLME